MPAYPPQGQHQNQGQAPNIDTRSHNCDPGLPKTPAICHTRARHTGHIPVDKKTQQKKTRERLAREGAEKWKGRASNGATNKEDHAAPYSPGKGLAAGATEEHNKTKDKQQTRSPGAKTTTPNPFKTPTKPDNMKILEKQTQTQLGRERTERQKT